MTAPYMQFYPADYLADTMHLTIEEHGAYLKLMFCMWQAGGWLPDNDKDISRVLGVTVGKWVKIKERVSPFFIYESGRFTQEKLQKTLQKMEEKRSALKSNGSKGGEAKALKEKESALANARDLPQHRARNPNSNIHIDTEDSLRSSSAESPPEPPPPDFKKIIFDEGLRYLAERSGRKLEALRSLVAKWCKDWGDAKVASAIVAAQQFGAVEPISFIEKHFAGDKQNGKPSAYQNKPTKDDRARAAVMRAAEQLGFADAGKPGG